MATKQPVIARLMLPDDANIYGKVHGGTILKMMEQAGFVVAARHCNQSSNPEFSISSSSDTPATPSNTVFSESASSNCRTPFHNFPVLAHIAQVTFAEPGYVGELAKVYARCTFTSMHSVEVLVEVFGENLLSGHVRRTNSALLTYVNTDPTQTRELCKYHPVPIPQLHPETEEEKALFDAGKQRYEKRKAEQGASPLGGPCPGLGFGSAEAPSIPTVTLVQVMQPSDCWGGSVVAGGVVMKLMDNAAGCAAARHCGAIAVTAQIEALDLRHCARLADVVHVLATPVFSSAKSVIIGVRVEVERVGIPGRFVVSEGHFTMVALDAQMQKAVTVPPVIPITEGEKMAFEKGKQLYEARRAAREVGRC